MNNTKILFLKNIVPPYRISLFNKLHFYARKEEVTMELFVFNRQERGRNWILDDKKLVCNTFVDDRGFYFPLRGIHFRFNPTLYKFLKNRPDHKIICGSSWNDINIIFIVLLKRMGFIKNKIGFWSEANYHTIHKTGNTDGSFKYWFRKKILDTCDFCFLLPGEIAQKTIFNTWGVDKKPYVYFPNLPAQDYVENFILNKRTKETDVLRIIIPARHNERHKGILNFIKQLNSLKGLQIFLAGEGDDTGSYQNYISEHGLQDHIHILGNISTTQLIEQYKAAHLFVLPSYYDQSPLTIVEAAKMGLPLLVSERCGNHPELIVEGENGFTFNPYDAEKINKIITLLLNADTATINKMGNRSLEIVKEAYNEEKILNDFLKAVQRHG